MPKPEYAIQALQAIIASGVTIIEHDADGKKLDKYEAAANEAVKYAEALDRRLGDSCPYCGSSPYIRWRFSRLDGSAYLGCSSCGK